MAQTEEKEKGMMLGYELWEQVRSPASHLPTSTHISLAFGGLPHPSLSPLLGCALPVGLSPQPCMENQGGTGFRIFPYYRAKVLYGAHVTAFTFLQVRDLPAISPQSPLSLP